MYHPQVRLKAGERASKNPKLFGEASGTARYPQASRAAWGVGPQWAQHGHAPRFTHRTMPQDQDVAQITQHPSEKPGFRFH